MTDQTQLRPHESMALTVALAQLHRGDDVTPNVAQVCIFALGRICGRVDYDAEEGTATIPSLDKPHVRSRARHGSCIAVTGNGGAP